MSHLSKTLPESLRRAAGRRAPRGNTLVLVTAILVLLVIVATAFISRTQAGRNVSAAQQAAAGRDQRVESIAEDVAGMISGAIFPQPVDPTALAAGLGIGYRQDPNDPAIRTVVASFPRLQTPAAARPFQVDRDFDGDLLPDFAYNAPSYAVVPWTNWPDFLSDAFPRGPGQPDGAVVTPGNNPIGDGNPFGNPGFGDNRWLRSTEPVRADFDGDGIPDGFSHWPHLSWIATANNGYRVVRDISDIVGTTLVNTNESNFAQPWALGLPYEQWLHNVPPAPVASAADFFARRDAWFGPLSGANNYIARFNTTAALPNFFRLADLKANPADPPNPADAFRPGTIRNAIERTLTDADGDGFTDSFWFLAPTPVDRAIRYIVGVSIVDNSALVNANVATRFDRRNTFGATPSDVALIGDPITPGRQVGFFDNPAHGYPFASIPAPPAHLGPLPTLFRAADINDKLFNPVAVGYTRDRFGDGLLDGLTFLQQIGMKDAAGNRNPALSDPDLPANERAEFYSARERQLYFRNGPLRGDEPRFALTPFGVGDELELRAFHGTNNPWTMSRFERAVNTDGNIASFLRSSPDREENSEYLDRLTNRQLMLDNRRKLTLFSGARNDRLPPWLWPTPYPDPSVDYDRDGQVGDTDGNPATIEDPVAAAADFAAYVRQTQRVDLRRAMDDPIGGSLTPPPPAVIEERRRQWRADLQQMLERTLTRSWDVGGATLYRSYLGRRDDLATQYQRQQFDKTRSMVASMTANIDQYRDGPIVLGTPPNVIVSDPPLHPALAVQDPVDGNLRYIGQEKQPYIMEAFVAVVYPKSALNLPPAVPGQVDPYRIPVIFPGGGEKFVDSSSKPGVVVAVQIANPHDVPISLFDFRLRFFGRSYSFATGTYGAAVTLAPATEAGPSTAIVYAFKDSPGAEAPPAGFPFIGSWLQFLDITEAELFVPAGNLEAQTKVFDASSAWLAPIDIQAPAVNPNNPLNDPNADAIELVRVIGPQAGPGAGAVATVVVDRFDNRVSGAGVEFAESLSRLFTDPAFVPPIQNFEYDPANPPDRNWMNGILLGTDDYFVTWVRASRAWRWDVWLPNQQVGDGVIRPDEINPRYVFSIASEPTLPTRAQDGLIGGANASFKGDRYAFNQNPDGPDLWISYSYRSIFGEERRGKPTFFTLVTRTSPGSADNVYGLGFPYPDAFGVYPPDVILGDKGLALSDWQEIAKYSAMRGPLQMHQKDADFDQIGEILNVFCWGPIIDVGGGINSPATERTFSELMLQERDDEDQPVGRGLFVNRLRLTPFRDPDTDGRAPTDGPTPILDSPPVAPYVPALPAGLGLFDALVCDDRGLARLDADGNGTITQAEFDAAELRRPRNAAGYEGRATPGLVNLNTALLETLKAMPHMTRLASSDRDFGPVGGPQNILAIAPALNPFTRVAESLVRYRDRSIRDASGTISPPVPNPNLLPGYVDRGLAENAIPGTNGFLEGMRAERGIGSIGELMLLQRFLDDPGYDLWAVERSYSIEFAGLDPYRQSVANPTAGGVGYASGVAYRIATDVTNGRTVANPQQQAPLPLAVPDVVGGDSEERSLLFAGISNLVSTRSDVFTVYLRIRAVRQDSVTGVWDGTRPELIVDDSRYVMIVDRSGVNSPSDRPRILALRKVPN